MKSFKEEMSESFERSERDLQFAIDLPIIIVSVLILMPVIVVAFVHFFA